MEKSIVALFHTRAKEFSNDPALRSKDKSDKFGTISYSGLYEAVSMFGAGLAQIGVARGTHIGIISDNRKEWMFANLGILGIGAVDVPRGSDSTEDEIAYILHHADCTYCIVEDEVQLTKLLSIREKLPLLKTIIVIDENYSIAPDTDTRDVSVFLFGQIVEKGKTALARNPALFEDEIAITENDDLATIIYTSGTTGEPKGVMLTHANFLHQIRAPLAYLNVMRGDVFLSVLPIWHAFERSNEYIALFAGCSIAYSKLIGKVMLADIEAVRPTIFPSVPRIWELVRTGIYKKAREEGGFRFAMFQFFIGIGSIHAKLLSMARGLLPQFKKRYRIPDLLVSFLPLALLTPLMLLGRAIVFSKIKRKLGGRFRFGVSGAGALPQYVDDFFAGCGVMLLEGYGLTEASPICSVRIDRAPVPGTIGPILPEMEAKVVDRDGNAVKPGVKGILLVKGPNVMKGYYKRPEETDKVISKDGWLNTGDLVVMTHKGELAVRGRVKETIVLTGGKNVEPSPIEDVILQSEYINQVMVIGQDQKFLGALVILNRDITENYAKETGIGFENFESLAKSQKIADLVRSEIGARINMQKGFKPFERIAKIRILDTEFIKGIEMTHTLKLRRDVISEKYKKEIEALFRQ
jgi:long-chain acyl-CoA synthetase